MLYPALATLAFALLWIGFAVRKRSRVAHASLMSAGMLLDLSLVLTLEITKNAIATALGPDLSPTQYAHILSSTLAVLFYFPVFTLGFIRLRHPHAPVGLRKWHIRLGYVALALRSLGFFFMFSMLARP